MTTEPRPRRGRILRLLAQGTLCLAICACGADAGAPAPLEADAGHPCPPFAEMAPTLSGMLSRGELPGIARLLGERVGKDELSGILDSAFSLIRALPGEKLNALVDLLRSERIRPAFALVRDLLTYARTGGPGGGLNGELLGELSALLQSCAAEPLFETLRSVLQTPAVLDLLPALRATLAMPEIRPLLDVAGALNREGLAELLCNVEAALVLPGVDPQQSVRRLLDAVGALTDLTTRPPVSDLVDGGLALLSPTGPLLLPVQSLLCCDLYGTSSCPAAGAPLSVRSAPPVFSHLIYDVFLSHPETLDPVLGLLAEPDLAATLQPLVDVLALLLANADDRTRLTRLLVTLLDPTVAGEVLPELDRLLASGAFDELLTVVAAVLESCPAGLDGGLP